MFSVSVGEYEVCCQANGTPSLLTEYRQRAALSEDFPGPDVIGSSVCFVSVRRHGDWPFLVVVQRYDPAVCGFHPGLLLVPEADRLFIGAGCRLLAYDLTGPARLWEDQAGIGFWSWKQFGPVVVMAAELELAAWDVSGRKLWSRYVEPPWDYTVADGIITVDVMGDVSRFHLVSGEPVKLGESL